MGYSTDSMITMVCKFNLAELEDWKVLCVMFKNETWARLLRESVGITLNKPKPAEDDAFEGRGAKLCSAEFVDDLEAFFKTVEPELKNDVDLKPMHTQLFALFDGPQNERFEQMPEDTIYNLEIVTHFGSGDMW
jgi:hypothetical protein